MSKKHTSDNPMLNAFRALAGTNDNKDNISRDKSLDDSIWHKKVNGRRKADKLMKASKKHDIRAKIVAKRKKKKYKQR